MRLLSVFSGTYVLFNRGLRYIERSKYYTIHVKLPGMFNYNPGIYTYCGCVINFIGHYMVFTSFRVFRI